MLKKSKFRACFDCDLCTSPPHPRRCAGRGTAPGRRAARLVAQHGSAPRASRTRRAEPPATPARAARRAHHICGVPAVSLHMNHFNGNICKSISVLPYFTS